jgi:tRNA(Ile)-lysidine synthase
VPLAPSIRLPRRGDPTVRGIARSWRRLTGGTRRGADRARRTLIACSGGGDSCGLVLALAAAVSEPNELFVVAHIVHDLRAQKAALADASVAESLASMVGVPFVRASIQIRTRPGNAEANARRARYRALAGLAVEQGCPFVATAHHEDDQLESMLMALVRGSGPPGLSGVAAQRSEEGCRIIRPALGVASVELRRLCTEAGFQWTEDATNADRSRLRAALRHGVVPELKRLRPRVAAGAQRAAGMLRDAGAVVNDRARGLLAEARAAGDALTWDRAALSRERGITLGCLLKLAADRLTAGRGQDRLGTSALRAPIRAIRSRSDRPRTFEAGPIVVHVGPVVEIRRRAHA